MESEKIEFQDNIDKKVTPELTDNSIDELRKKSISKLEQKQMDNQVKLEAGMTEIPKTEDSVPKELPKMVFKIAGKAIKCEKMPLDDDEAKVLAKQLSILIGSQNSKIYAVMMILVIIIGKLWVCWDAVAKMFKRKDKKEKETPDIEIAKAEEVME